MNKENICKEYPKHDESEIISDLCQMGVKFIIYTRQKHEPNNDLKPCYCCSDIVYSNNPKLGPVIFYNPVCNSL